MSVVIQNKNALLDYNNFNINGNEAELVLYKNSLVIIRKDSSIITRIFNFILKCIRIYKKIDSNKMKSIRVSMVNCSKNNSDEFYAAYKVADTIFHNLKSHDRLSFQRVQTPKTLQPNTTQVRYSIFGAQEWNEYYGNVGNIPPLPPNIKELMNAPCPFWPKRKVKDTHELILIPSMVGKQPFTLRLWLEKLIVNPKKGNPISNYVFNGLSVNEHQSLQEHKPSFPYWILITKEKIPDSGGKSYQGQCNLVTNKGYRLPKVIEAAVSAGTAYNRNRESRYTPGVTLCVDRFLLPPRGYGSGDDRCPGMVSGYHKNEGMFVSFDDHYDDPVDFRSSSFGVAAVRILKIDESRKKGK